MGISETQLETWSRQGSVTQSAATYNTIKVVLESSGTPYADKSCTVFLQGSYGNDTNIYAESDVDIVIRMDGVFQHDLSELSESEKTSFHQTLGNATYTYDQFKADVVSVLTRAYGSSVNAGRKAISIAASGGRRKADVVVAMQFRRYFKFNGILDQKYVEGICFYTSDGTRIINYPKQHAANVTTKHKATSSWFKPMVRVVKNMRQRMVETGRLSADVAPSY